MQLPWRNRLARSAVNRKVAGSSPAGSDVLPLFPARDTLSLWSGCTSAFSTEPMSPYKLLRKYTDDASRSRLWQGFALFVQYCTSQVTAWWVCDYLQITDWSSIIYFLYTTQRQGKTLHRLDFPLPIQSKITIHMNYSSIRLIHELYYSKRLLSC